MTRGDDQDLRGHRGGSPRLFDLEVDPMTPRPPSGQDAATFIEERTRHGEHVLANTVTGWQLLHPGCGLPCEYSAALELTPGMPADAPAMFVARIDKDGRLTPDREARWEDVVSHELIRQAEAGL